MGGAEDNLARFESPEDYAADNDPLAYHKAVFSRFPLYLHKEWPAEGYSFMGTPLHSPVETDQEDSWSIRSGESSILEYSPVSLKDPRKHSKVLRAMREGEHLHSPLRHFSLQVPPVTTGQDQPNGTHDGIGDNTLTAVDGASIQAPAIGQHQQPGKQDANGLNARENRPAEVLRSDIDSADETAAYSLPPYAEFPCYDGMDPLSLYLTATANEVYYYLKCSSLGYQQFDTITSHEEQLVSAMPRSAARMQRQLVTMTRKTCTNVDHVDCFKTKAMSFVYVAKGWYRMPDQQKLSKLQDGTWEAGVAQVVQFRNMRDVLGNHNVRQGGGLVQCMRDDCIYSIIGIPHRNKVGNRDYFPVVPDICKR